VILVAGLASRVVGLVTALDVEQVLVRHRVEIGSLGLFEAAGRLSVLVIGEVGSALEHQLDPEDLTGALFIPAIPQLLVVALAHPTELLLRFLAEDLPRLAQCVRLRRLEVVLREF